MNVPQVLDEVSFPDDWRVARLASIAPRSRSAGRADLQPLSVFLDVGVVPRADRADNHNALGEDLSKYLHVLPGDIVFNKLRTWQGGLGVARHEGIVSPAYFVCRTGPEVEPRFLHYLLRSAPYLAELTRRSKWMPPSQFDIPWDELRTLPVVVPPLDEQRRIADFLDTETTRLDALVAARTGQKRTLVERYRSAVHHLYGEPPSADFLEGRVGPSRPLRHLLERTIGGRTPDASVVDDGEIPWLAISDLIDGGEVTAGSRSFSRPTLRAVGLSPAPAGAVVLAMYASLGKVAVLANPAAFNQAIIGLVPHADVPSAYLMGWFELMQPALPALARTATQPNLNAEQIRSLRFPLHGDAEMAEIAAQRASLQDQLRRASAALDRAQALVAEHRQALITAAVTGQLDVTTARGGVS